MAWGNVTPLYSGNVNPSRAAKIFDFIQPINEFFSGTLGIPSIRNKSFGICQRYNRKAGRGVASPNSGFQRIWAMLISIARKQNNVSGLHNSPENIIG